MLLIHLLHLGSPAAAAAHHCQLLKDDVSLLPRHFWQVVVEDDVHPRRHLEAAADCPLASDLAAVNGDDVEGGVDDHVDADLATVHLDPNVQEEIDDRTAVAALPQREEVRHQYLNQAELGTVPGGADTGIETPWPPLQNPPASPSAGYPSAETGNSHVLAAEKPKRTWN